MSKDKYDSLMLLKTARGQVEATIRMMEEERYCVDVSNQIIATIALLKKANTKILKQHMEHCVTEAFENGNGPDKIEEIVTILSKLT